MRHMIRLLFAPAAVLVLGAQAQAADLVIEQPPVVIPAAAAFDWSGFYMGAYAGYGFGTLSWEDIAITGSHDLGGALLGVSAGANAQHGTFVLGVEGDVAWSGITGKSGDVLAGPDTFEYTTDVEWLATLRARAGVAMDTVLLYGTAGLAVAGTTTTSVGTFVGVGTFTNTASHTLAGWVAGVGAEMMVTENLSLKAEYLYHNFGRTNDVFNPVNVVFHSQVSASTVKVGANLHF